MSSSPVLMTRIYGTVPDGLSRRTQFTDENIFLMQGTMPAPVCLPGDICLPSFRKLKRMNSEE